MKDIVLTLYDIGAIKFGSFQLKSGIISPIYIDLRESISFPHLMKAIAESMWNKISDKTFDRVCGVPYTALPIASYLSIAYNVPMIMRRKEAKDYGTKKIVEGVYLPNHTCVIFEDLISSGASIFETIAPIEQAGMKVHDIVAFLDREQGGRQKIESQGYRFHSVVTLSHSLNILLENGRINHETREKIRQFTQELSHV
jgi:uridine monophosphate synthetase